VSTAASAKGARSGIRLAIAGLLVAAIAAFFLLGGHRWLTLAQVQSHRDDLLAFTNAHYGVAALCAFALYATSTALSLPGGLVMSLSIGFLFGRWIGTAVIVAGATLGAAIVFAAARYVFADAARARAGALADRINRGFSANAFSYMLFLRLTPLFPFWLVNIAPALSSIPMRTFVIATGVGIIPGTFVYANLGQSLGTIGSTKDLISLPVVGSLALLGVVSLVPVWIGRRSAARSRESV